MAVMPDDEIPPELSDEQRMRQWISRDSAGSMFTDDEPSSRLAAWNQWNQTNGIWAETRDSLNLPDDAGEHAAGLAAILRRIPDGRGRWIGVDAGWYPLICELDSVLAELDPGYVVQQAKEKFGRLAFYASSENFAGLDNAFRNSIRDAQERSCRICELCSAPGCLHETGPMGPPGRWVKTLCPACAAAGYRGRSYTPVKEG
jgi:hypothetical protein